MDSTAALEGMRDSLEGWSDNLKNVRYAHSRSQATLTCITNTQLKLENKAGDTALITMTKNVSARLEVKMRKRLSDLIFHLGGRF